MLNKIQNRITQLDNWLDKEGIKEEQAHLIKDSREKLYWHYGYLMALKDVLALLFGKIPIHHKQDTYN